MGCFKQSEQLPPDIQMSNIGDLINGTTKLATVAKIIEGMEARWSVRLALYFITKRSADLLQVHGMLPLKAAAGYC